MRLHARRGIALVAALGLMTLLGLLIAGAFSATLRGEQSSRLALSDAVLGAAADYAITTIVGDPRGYGLAQLPFGQTRTFDVSAPNAAGARTSVVVTRLPAGVLWLVADASLSGADEGHRRINMVARFPSLAPPPAAVVARGNVVLRDSVTFTVDSSGDPDCAAPPETFDVVTALGATVASVDSVHGVVSSSAGDSSTYYMTARQIATLDSGAAAVHVRGDTTIAGGTFTGILLVDGTLTVSGPFIVAGLVIARRSIVATAGGLSVTGAIMAFGTTAGATPAIDIRNATIRYAPCTIATALRLALPPKPVPQRGWAELF